MATPLRLLMLEDNASDAELALHALRRAGYDPVGDRVETERDFRDGLRSAPEVILADFSLPEFDAPSALGVVQGCRLDIPFIIVSGTIGEERAVEVMRQGASDYVIKDRLGRLGQAVAHALEKKALRDEARLAERCLSAQHDATRALAESPDLDAAVPRVFEAVCTSMGWAWAAAWMAAPHGNSLGLVHAWNPPSADAAGFLAACREKTFARGEGLPGRVWASGQPVWVADVMLDENFFGKHAAAGAGLHSAFAFPILLGRDVLGVIEFLSQRVERPDEKILGMMTAVGSQIGQFIERSRKEEALRRSEERFQELTGHIDQVLWVIDAPESKIIYVSRGYEKLWGRSCQSLLGDPRSYLDGIHPLDRELMARENAVMYETGHIDAECRVLRPDGSVRWAWIRGYPVTERGRLARVAGVIEDVTEKRLMAAERDALLTRLQLHIERMPLGYVLFDEAFRISDWNTTAERIFGYARGEMLGKGPPYEAFMPRAFWEKAEELRSRIRYGDMEAHSVNENLTKDGRTITCQWFNTPLMDDEGRFVGFLCLVQDVTERKSLEAQFRQAQKMDAFGQLAGGVAHDFNNLLTIISGYSELLLSRLRSNDPMRRLVQAISEAGGRAAALTRQLLAFCRKTVLEPKVLDLNEVVRETENFLRRLIGEDILFTAVLDPTISRVRVDPDLLGQVMMNLAVNARDAMPTGGKLTVETCNVELGEENSHSRSGVHAGRYVVLSLTDTGMGMSEEVKARIFEPFFTTKEVGKGTGLGLAVVLGVVKQSDGHVEVLSEPGNGTTFEVYFPAVEEKVAERGGIDGGQGEGGSETVLLVEDDEGVRGLAVLVLETHGYKVLAASNGKEAMRLVDQHQGGIDILVTDVVMPGMGGPQLAEALRSRLQQMKVLYASGYTDDAVVRHGLMQESVAFLQKPYTPLTLTRKLRQVLDGKKSASGSKIDGFGTKMSQD